MSNSDSNSLIIEFLNSVQPDTVFTVIVTLVTFISGLAFKLSYDTYSRRKYLKNRCKFFVESATSLIKPIKKQANSYKKLSDSIADKKNHRFTLGFVPELNFFFFSSDVIADLHIYNHKRFFKKANNNSIKNISKAINTIERQLINSKYNLESLVDKQESLSLDWEKASDKIFRYYDSIVQYKIINKITEEDPLYNKFLKILDRWSKSRDDDDLELTKDLLLNPLKEMCNTIDDDPRTLQILPSVNECLNIIERINNNRKIYQSIFLNDFKQLSGTLETYEEAIKDLDRLT